MNLSQWYKVYAKHKDLIKKSLKEIQETDEGLLVTYKGKKERVICSKEFVSIPASKEHIVLVIFNSRKNIEAVVRNWQALVESPQLKIIFVNIQAQRKWILWPAVHAKVAEESNLLEGLLGLSENVPFTDAEQVQTE